MVGCLICGGACRGHRVCWDHWAAFQALGWHGQRLLCDLGELRPAFSVWPRQRDPPPVEQPAEVVRGLFIGDLDDAADADRLQLLGVNFVVNLCPEQLQGPYAGLCARLASRGIRQVLWPADDSGAYDIVEEVLARGVFESIDVALLHGKVLVCCWGGCNRSGAVVAGYLVSRRRFALRAAMALLQQCRGTVLTTGYFRYLLVRASLLPDGPLADPRSV